MKTRKREILTRAIENGIMRGYQRAHKHVKHPDENLLCGKIVDEIWLEIDAVFSFADEDET